MRLTLGVAAMAFAAVLVLPGGLAAQLFTPAPKQVAPAVKRAAPAAPPTRQALLTEKLNQNTVTVISGNPNGTYLYLAYDMSAVLDDGNDLRVLPIIGKGGYQNVMDVLHLKGVDLCITQANIMSYLKKTGEFGANIDARLAYVARLYNEEMHVLAGPGINRIQDLSGKKVNFSDVGSGTQFSTRLIFELLGIKAEEVNMGQADGYQKVKSGEIAATVLIAGKPTGSFAKFKLEPGMTLLPVPYTEALEQDYLPSQADARGLPGPHSQGQLGRHRRHPLRARRLQLAARHRSLSPRGEVRRRLLQQVCGIPAAGAPRQMEGSQYHGHLARLAAVSRGGGVAGKECRQAGCRRARRHRSGRSCARRRPRPHPTIRPSRSACSSSSWIGRKRKSARPRAAGEARLMPAGRRQPGDSQSRGKEAP